MLISQLADAATFVYVSMAPEQKIQIYRLNPDSGALAHVDTLAVDGAPGCLKPDPQRRFLFASLRTTSSLASFRIDRATGKLTPLNVVKLPQDENAAFVTTDRTGRWLLSASYIAGNVVIHRIADDGTIEYPAVQTVATEKTAHSVILDRLNQRVFVPHVTPNAIYQFRLDAQSGKSTLEGKAAGGRDKSGPRHLALHPDLDFAYTSDESGSSITCYRIDGSTGLGPVQTVSTLPADFQGRNTTAEVKVHPSGKFVWVSNRGHDSLAGFTIDRQSGLVQANGQTPTEATPRSFDIDPSGRFLLSAGEGSGRLAVFRIDTDTGRLDRLQTIDVGKSLTWVATVDASVD
jgi:6-phosphogluconolactonase